MLDQGRSNKIHLVGKEMMVLTMSTTCFMMNEKTQELSNAVVGENIRRIFQTLQISSVYQEDENSIRCR